MPSKRERIDGGRGGKHYVRRNKQGQFKEVESVGRSNVQDRRRQAENPSTPGQGDRGDRDVQRKR
jgi:hypothetical protein